MKIRKETITLGTMEAAGTCPKCQQPNLKYGRHHFDGECLIFNWICQNCKTKGEEWHYIKFIRHQVNE